MRKLSRQCAFAALLVLINLIVVTKAEARPKFHVVASGETAGHIALRYGCRLVELKAANPKELAAPEKLAIGAKLRIPRCERKPAPSRGSGRQHLVADGESMWSIAGRYGCSHKELMAANSHRIKDPRLIQIGQPLVIPRCSGKQPGPRARRSRSTNCSWSPDDFEEGKLRKLMLARGFRPPPKFRAMIVEIRMSRNRKRIVGQRLLSYGRLAWEHKGWNPASTVKLFAAISALEQVRRYGFGINTRVTFHYPRGDKTFKLMDLYEDAMHWSKNIPHNRLVQLAGFDFLNGAGGTLQRAGLDHTYIMRAYDATKWQAEGHSKWLKNSPRITLREGRRKRTIPARRGRGRYPCNGAACTSLADLAKTMCRMMLHEQLPPHKRLRLGGDGQSPHLKLLRSSMDRKRKGTHDTEWATFRRRFPEPKGYRLFHKGGFARDWVSDNYYIYNPRLRRRWIITMAAYPGRHSLAQADKLIADIILEDKY